MGALHVQIKQKKVSTNKKTISASFCLIPSVAEKETYLNGRGLNKVARQQN